MNGTHVRLRLDSSRPMHVILGRRSNDRRTLLPTRTEDSTPSAGPTDMMTRLEAIQDIRCGRGICVSLVGLEAQYDRYGGRHEHTFSVIIRRGKKGCAEALIDCSMMGTVPRNRWGVLPITLTWKQVLNFIRLHYIRGERMEVHPPSHIQPLARVA